NFQVKKSGEQNWGWMNVVQPGDGSFVVLGLDQGRYDLQITTEGYAPTVLAGVAAGERDLAVVVQKGLEPAGVGRDGGAAPGAAFANNQGQLQLATEQGDTLCTTQLKSDGTFEFKNVPTSMKWRINGWAWTSGGYRMEHDGLVESAATDVKVVAKPNR